MKYFLLCQIFTPAFLLLFGVVFTVVPAVFIAWSFEPVSRFIEIVSEVRAVHLRVFLVFSSIVALAFWLQSKD